MHTNLMNFSYDVEEANFDELVMARSHEVPVLLDISTNWKVK
jgi:putative thioredoxin